LFSEFFEKKKKIAVPTVVEFTQMSLFQTFCKKVSEKLCERIIETQKEMVIIRVYLKGGPKTFKKISQFNRICVGVEGRNIIVVECFIMK
jgi:hypothetical protein